MEYDLKKRTEIFAENIIDICKKSKKTPISIPIINQLIRSGTSVGANYMEANGACSRKDFKHKIFLCKKELQETEYWLKMLQKSSDNDIENLGSIKKENRELILIFNKISNSLKIEN